MALEKHTTDPTHAQYVSKINAHPNWTKLGRIYICRVAHTSLLTHMIATRLIHTAKHSTVAQTRIA